MQDNSTNNMWYSEPLQVVSVAVGATQVATMNYDGQGARGILITNIILSSGIVAGAANLVTFTDQFGRVILVMNSSRDGNGPTDLKMYIPSGSYIITASFAAAIAIAEYRFTVCHQFLSESKPKKFGFQHHA